MQPADTNRCWRCGRALGPDEGRVRESRAWCDDCYLDAVVPRVRTMNLENNRANFMVRLKYAYPAVKQRFD